MTPPPPRRGLRWASGIMLVFQLQRTTSRSRRRRCWAAAARTPLAEEVSRFSGTQVLVVHNGQLQVAVLSTHHIPPPKYTKQLGGARQDTCSRPKHPAGTACSGVLDIAFAHHSLSGLSLPTENSAPPPGQKPELLASRASLLELDLERCFELVCPLWGFWAGGFWARAAKTSGSGPCRSARPC